MRCCRVVRASDTVWQPMPKSQLSWVRSQFSSDTSGIWGAADEAVLIKVLKKSRKIPLYSSEIEHEYGMQKFGITEDCSSWSFKIFGIFCGFLCCFLGHLTREDEIVPTMCEEVCAQKKKKRRVGLQTAGELASGGVGCWLSEREVERWEITVLNVELLMLLSRHPL